jgi:hypothetical protein
VSLSGQCVARGPQGCIKVSLSVQSVARGSLGRIECP